MEKRTSGGMVPSVQTGSDFCSSSVRFPRMAILFLAFTFYLSYGQELSQRETQPLVDMSFRKGHITPSAYVGLGIGNSQHNSLHTTS